MTEKRFTFHHDVDGIDYIQDETNGFCFICDKLLCSLLNELNDENEQLRNNIKIKLCNNCIYWRMGTAGLNDNYCSLTNEWVDWEGTCEKWKGVIVTEKRFGMYQNTLYDDGNILNPFNAMKLLNSFDKENTKLKEENKELKRSYTQLRHRHSLLHDVCLDAECERDSLKKDVESLEKENEQLKHRVEFFKALAEGVY